MSEKYKILLTESFGPIFDSLVSFFLRETDWEIYALSPRAEKEISFSSLKIIPVDFSDFKKTKSAIYDISPDYVINLLEVGAPYSKAASKTEIWRFLVQLPEVFVSACRVMNVPFAVFSNEYIFGGLKGPFDESAVPSSEKSYYGTAVHARENLCASRLDKYVVVRVPSLYGQSFSGGFELLSFFQSLIAKNGELSLPDSYISNPLHLDDLAFGFYKIISKKAFGVYHFGGEDFLSVLAFADKYREIFELELDIKISDSEDFFGLPQKGGLINFKAKSELGVSFSGVKSGLIASKFYLPDRALVEFLKKVLYVES